MRSRLIGSAMATALGVGLLAPVTPATAAVTEHAALTCGPVERISDNLGRRGARVACGGGSDATWAVPS